MSGAPQPTLESSRMGACVRWTRWEPRIKRDDMLSRSPFRMDPSWSFGQFLDELFGYYRGGGIEGTGYRLNAIRNWLSMVGRTRAVEAFRRLEADAGTNDEAELAASLWMSKRSY